jgi:hypothetical protein
MTDFMPQVLKIAKGFRLNARAETQEMMGIVADMSSAFGVVPNVMLEALTDLSSKAYMSGQDISKSTTALYYFGKAAKGLVGNSAELGTLFESLAKTAGGFDITKFMAVMPGEGDIASRYREALKEGPIQALYSYIGALGKEIDSKDKAAAIAMTQFKDLGAQGIVLADALLKINPKAMVGKSEDDMKKMLMQNGIHNEHLAEIGAMQLAGSNFQEKIFDLLKESFASLFDIFASLPDWMSHMTKAQKDNLNSFRTKLQVENNQKTPSVYPPHKTW